MLQCLDKSWDNTNDDEQETLRTLWYIMSIICIHDKMSDRPQACQWMACDHTYTCPHMPVVI